MYGTELALSPATTKSSMPSSLGGCSDAAGEPSAQFLRLVLHLAAYPRRRRTIALLPPARPRPVATMGA